MVERMRGAVTVTRFNHNKEAVRNGLYEMGMRFDWMQGEGLNREGARKTTAQADLL